jgi:cellulose biosynthesis protein BcsQ
VILALAIDPTASATLYAGTAGGVFKTTNGAANWNAANAGLGSLVILALGIDPSATATIYAGTNGAGVFKTINAAVTWSAASSGL